jgi:hypothetical protein
MQILAIFLLFSVQAWAQTQAKKAAPAKQPTVTVWTKGHVSSARRLFSPDLPVKVLGREEEKERDRDSGHLQPRERNALFRKVGIETKVAKMDELEKDMLVMSAREYSIRELKSEYPKIPEPQLKRLKEELGKMK